MLRLSPVSDQSDQSACRDPLDSLTAVVSVRALARRSVARPGSLRFAVAVKMCSSADDKPGGLCLGCCQFCCGPTAGARLVLVPVRTAGVIQTSQLRGTTELNFAPSWPHEVLFFFFFTLSLGGTEEEPRALCAIIPSSSF